MKIEHFSFAVFSGRRNNFIRFKIIYWNIFFWTFQFFNIFYIISLSFQTFFLLNLQMENIWNKCLAYMKGFISFMCIISNIISSNWVAISTIFFIAIFWNDIWFLNNYREALSSISVIFNICIRIINLFLWGICVFSDALLNSIWL